MELTKNTYRIQGVKLEDVAKNFGTPVYVYDADKIANQIKLLHKAFSGLNVRIKYAAKALTNLSILKLMRREGAGIDVVSIQEAHLGLKAGFQPDDILFTPNCVSFSEIQEAVKLGLRINIDNISILEQFGHEYHDTVPCCIRLNPHIMAGGNAKISTGHVDSKFGISILQKRHLLRIIQTYNIKVNGLHMHTGSDILDSEVFLKGAQIVFDIAHDFEDLEFLDFGSGFKVGYREGDVVTDVVALGKNLESAFQEFCKEYGRDLQVWFEPGKFLVSEAGYFLVRTNVIKTTPATVFAGVDSGLNHFIRPMMYDSYHEMVNISNPKGINRVYTIVGYICETDTLGWDRKLNEVREGDIIAIKNAGAYGFSMASNYNSRLRPAEVMIIDGQAKLIRERETFEDLIRQQVEIDI
ncbi:diaminopimelate decarboxylase [Fulvivirgaceae bacterium BMA10]|uniref:Diaminopimelate decarboxylase n=1 Tax=Splendidivirga corallicola TaxID=3051826 RepID=A0ABT8KLL3_9BACT|nr:diaminopimelate decarboxylase [Fulvivirgaceae bacterium BMA10]